VNITYSFVGSPMLEDFYHCWDKRTIGVMGPFGSGKSSACVMKLVAAGRRQTPGPDGVRRVRFAVIRNTYLQLRDTTIRTVMDWLPEAHFGRFQTTPRPEYRITNLDKNLEIELLFRALDNPYLSTCLRPYVHRFDTMDALIERLGNPNTILCLGNGPSSEDPRLNEVAYDASRGQYASTILLRRLLAEARADQATDLAEQLAAFTRIVSGQLDAGHDSVSQRLTDTGDLMTDVRTRLGQLSETALPGYLACALQYINICAHHYRLAVIKIFVSMAVGER